MQHKTKCNIRVWVAAHPLRWINAVSFLYRAMSVITALLICVLWCGWLSTAALVSSVVLLQWPAWREQAASHSTLKPQRRIIYDKRLSWALGRGVACLVIPMLLDDYVLSISVSSCMAAWWLLMLCTRSLHPPQRPLSLPNVVSLVSTSMAMNVAALGCGSGCCVAAEWDCSRLRRFNPCTDRSLVLLLP